jgi:LysM repeat protein
MPKKFFLIIALVVATTLLMSACVRPAQPMPLLASPTVQGSNPLPQATGISLVEAWGTSTAIYKQTADAQGLLPAESATPTVEAVATATITPLGFVPSATSLIPPTGGAPTATTYGTTPVIVVPTATPGRPASYTLQEGEFPYCIARRFNVNQQELLALNNLPDNPPLLQPGFSLKIPQTGNPFVGTRALHPHPTTYAVAANDTIYAIACYFGDIDPTSIAAANSLSLSSPLTIGRVLNIP